MIGSRQCCTSKVTKTSDLAQDLKQRSNSLLRRADEKVRKKQYAEALEDARSAYSLDATNMYARAYEERIVELMMEESREQQVNDPEQTAQQRNKVELDRQPNESHQRLALVESRAEEPHGAEHLLRDRPRQLRDCHR
jgi:uncharacterized membrane protein